MKTNLAMVPAEKLANVKVILNAGLLEDSFTIVFEQLTLHI